MTLDVMQPLKWIALLLAVFGLHAAHGQNTAAPAFEDSMAQRSLACTHCHGVQGRAAPDGYYPRIAGKPAGYLYNQLLHFREGRRHYGAMTQLLDPLSEIYLMEIAQYFAALQLPYPPPVPSRASKAVLERGRQLVREGDAARQVPACAACHGQQLTGVLPQVPGLLGLPRDYLNAQLGAWRTGKRRAHAPDCMATVAKALDIQDIEAVSSWLAAQPMPADSRPVAAAPPGRTPECGTAPAPTRSQR
jgi:cytochrome c553